MTNVPDAARRAVQLLRRDGVRATAARVPTRVRLARTQRRRATPVLDRPTYCWQSDDAVSGIALPDLRGGVPPTAREERALREVATLVSDGWIDVLGSGWVTLAPGTERPGFLGHRYPPVPWDGPTDSLNAANRAVAKEIRALAPDAPVLDWQVDVRSGHRWSESTWHTAIRHGQPGADIKVPWEIGRLHQLVWLARSGMPIRPLVVDFLASNPPGFGVNWGCAMDVGIRTANVVLAHALQPESMSDPEYRGLIAAAIHDHCRFIAENLEWSASLRSNHYLADVCGLAWGAAALGSSPQTDGWLAFATAQLLAEVDAQFDRDGANFEGSTSYHRLSTEIAVYTLALLEGLPEERLQRLPLVPVGDQPVLPDGTRPEAAREVDIPQHLLRKVLRAAEFTRVHTAPDGRITQLGDNDSGRFFKVAPAWRAVEAADAKRRWANLEDWDAADDSSWWFEDPGDHRHVSVICTALAGRPEDPADPETILIGRLTGDRARDQLAAPATPVVEIGRVAPDERLAALEAAGTHDIHRREFHAAHGSSLADAVTVHRFPSFGSYVWRSTRVHLVVRCGPLGQRGNGGHAHNDQLGMELWLDGEAVVRDPGTFVYTPDPELRNRYRSVHAHDAPVRSDGREPWGFDGGLFTLTGDPLGGVPLWVAPNRFVGEHMAYGSPTIRSITIDDSRIIVVDLVPKVTATELAGRAASTERASGQPPYSPGYGMMEAPVVHGRRAPMMDLVSGVPRPSGS